jgi:hypothetical protein
MLPLLLLSFRTRLKRPAEPNLLSGKHHHRAGATPRGPGSNDSNPRPKARRFSIFCLSPARPANFSAATVFVHSAVSLHLLLNRFYALSS